MKKHWFVAVAMLVTAILVACNLPRPELVPHQFMPYTKIKIVDVTPPSGSGNFIITVGYSFLETEGLPTKIINCYYVTPSGATMYFGKITPSLMGWAYDSEWPGAGDLPFSVQQADGRIEAGVYQAGCINEEQDSQATTSFTVNENTATPTAMLTTDTPTSTSPVPSPTEALPLVGKIIFDYYNSTNYGIYADSGYNELSYMSSFICSPAAGPEIMITPDGRISNTTCRDGINPPLHVAESTFTYEVSGMVDPSGNVQFTYEINQYGLDANGHAEGLWHVRITGQGKFTSPTQASGTASFTYTCDDDTIYSDVANKCGTSSNVLGHYTYSGELPWRFDPSQ